MNLPASELRSAASLQFSLRGLLLALAVTALFCALLAPVLRPWASAQRATFTLFLAGTLLIDAATLAGLCWRRRGIEHAAGPLLLRAEPAAARSWHVFSFVIVVALLAMIVMWSVLFTRTLERQDMSILLPTCGAAATLACIPPVVFYAWLGAGAWSLELRERGVIHQGIRFMPWRETLRFDWLPGEGSRLRMSTRDRDYLIDAPRQQRASIDAILHRHALLVDHSSAPPGA